MWDKKNNKTEIGKNSGVGTARSLRIAWLTEQHNLSIDYFRFVSAAIKRGYRLEVLLHIDGQYAKASMKADEELMDALLNSASEQMRIAWDMRRREYLGEFDAAPDLSGPAKDFPQDFGEDNLTSGKDWVWDGLL